MNMTNRILKIGFLTLALFSLTFSAEAQAMKNGGPPSWAPAHGYRANTNYIFFPEKNFYFDLEKRSYIYISSGTWQVSASLPGIYANIDLGNSVQVELALDSKAPQKFNTLHMMDYKSRYKKQKQNKGKGHGKKPA